MNKHIDNLIIAHIKENEDSKDLSQEFIKNNLKINESYKYFLKEKFEAYLKEIENFELFFENTKNMENLEIKKMIISDKTNFREHKIILNINENMNVEFKDNLLKLKIKGIKTFSIAMNKYAVISTSKKSIPSIVISNPSNKNDLEVKTKIKNYLNEMLKENSESALNIKKIYAKIQRICEEIYQIKNNQKKEALEGIIKVIANKDILNLKSEDNEMLMLLYDTKLDELIKKIKRTTKPTPKINNKTI